MIPFLSPLDLVRLRCVSKGFEECVSVGSKVVLNMRKNDIPKYYNFINTRFQTNLLKSSMLDQYKLLLKHGVKKDYVCENSYFTNNDATMSLLIFYLIQCAPNVLNRLLHCVIPRWSSYNRKMFRRMYWKVQLHFCKLKKNNLKKNTINCSKIIYQKKKMSKNLKKQTFSVPNTNTNLSTFSDLTESNLEAHNNHNQRKRKREIKKPELYAEKYQKDIVVSDDFKDDNTELAVENNTEEGSIEARSIDSQSEGSLKDFVVKSEDNVSVSSEENHSGEDEAELSDRETDEDSIHTSDMSDVYSDEDNE